MGLMSFLVGCVEGLMFALCAVAVRFLWRGGRSSHWFLLFVYSVIILFVSSIYIFFNILFMFYL